MIIKATLAVLALVFIGCAIAAVDDLSRRDFPFFIHMPARSYKYTRAKVWRYCIVFTALGTILGVAAWRW